MTTIETGSPAQGVLQSAQHVLFVEGKENSLDVTVLKGLLGPQIRVEPLGPCFSIRSAASALFAYHKNYWFVIDRDDWDDATVEASWKKFPDPSHENLLIWRRRELESYFIEPSWLVKSRYIRKAATQSKIQKWLEDEASKGVWLAAANMVLIYHRTMVKQTQGDLLTAGKVDCSSQAGVEEALVQSPLLANLRHAVSSRMTEADIRSAFHERCDALSGGVYPLRWAVGHWASMLPAKEIFRGLVNQWMFVPDQSKASAPRLVGREAERAVAVDLLKNHGGDAPADLVSLKQILSAQFAVP